MQMKKGALCIAQPAYCLQLGAQLIVNERIQLSIHAAFMLK